MQIENHDERTNFDVIVVGAGLGGLYATYRFQQDNLALLGPKARRMSEASGTTIDIQGRASTSIASTIRTIFPISC